jgi:hypothetical protein
MAGAAGHRPCGGVLVLGRIECTTGPHWRGINGLAERGCPGALETRVPLSMVWVSMPSWWLTRLKRQRAARRSHSCTSTGADMAGVRVTIPGDAGGTKTAQMHHAVANHWRLAMEAKERAARPKPVPVQRRTFAHIRDWREVIK